MNKEKEKKTPNKDKYKSNKIRYIPKADIEMLREDLYEQNGELKNKKYYKPKY